MVSEQPLIELSLLCTNMDELARGGLPVSVLVQVPINWGTGSAAGIWSGAYSAASDHVGNMHTWCCNNLDTHSWFIETNTSSISMLSRTFVFDNPEDAVAFKLRFGIIHDYIGQL
jgi:hypothetical protein